MSETVTSRFAPSPTGPLHLGHAFSAITAHDLAARAGGAFLLRIEDIDAGRCRPEWVEAICDDLRWLGLAWREPVVFQSRRAGAYRAALARLWQAGLLYECTCSRADIAAALAAPQEGAPAGPDGPVYPGTCRGRRDPSRAPDPTHALRLDMGRAMAALAGRAIAFTEAGRGPAGECGRIEIVPAEAVERIGDVVLGRRGWGTSYHLAVVVDDALQGVTDVVRGEDLFAATAIHAILQRLLGLPTPRYHHHRLIRDAQGRRLAKRDDARAIALYRAAGASPADIRRMVGL